MNQQLASQIQIRWMIRRDLREVMDIEQQVFEFPWTEEELLNCLMKRNCIAMTAELENRIVGFMVYELHKSALHILNFAVKGSCRRAVVLESLWVSGRGSYQAALELHRRGCLSVHVYTKNGR